MDERGYRQNENEMSTASLAKLDALFSSLRAAADGSVFLVPEFKRLLWQRRILIRREHRANPITIRPEHEDAARDLIGGIEEAVKGIAGCLNEEWRNSVIEVRSPDQDGPVWTLGKVTFIYEQYSILRGAMELRRSEPIAAGLSEIMIAFLVAVPGTRDKITRENHGHWGYHYHYLDSKDRRSDTLLTFDQKSANAARPTLRWERHAEADGFKARAGTWGSDKRESVYSVCHPDTSRFNLSNFKRPASDAEIVWPLTVAVAAAPVRA